MLEEAFGTDSIDLGAEYSDEEEDAVYGDVEDNYSDDSYMFEGSDSADDVAQLDWDLELVPKRKERSKLHLPSPSHKHESRYTYPS